MLCSVQHHSLTLYSVLEMARLLVAPAISFLLLAALASAAAAAAAADDPPAKKVGMRMRHASKEEARWLDRYAETHAPLGAGPLRMRRATAEEAQWLDRFSAAAGGDTSENDGEDGGSGGGGNYIEFDDDNPYVEAVRAWASRLMKQGLEKAQAENPFQDL